MAEMEASQYGLKELSELSGTSVRTIRYYIQERLVPRPHGRGPKAAYGDEHLDRLLLIRNLQDGGETLEQIRDLLAVMDESDVQSSLADLARERHRPPAPADSSEALEYIRTARASGLTSARVQHSASLRDAAVRSGPQTSAPGGSRLSTWEHIALTPDIELHVRRPLPRTQHRDLDKLLEKAREIFGKDLP